MEKNTQPIKKQVKNTAGNILEVHSIFQTIQGEGPYAGSPSVFVRLAGCNLRCPYCDTEYTDGMKAMVYKDIYNQIAKMSPPNNLVVITGGEPFRQNLMPLINLLHDHNYTVQIETNGTLFFDFPLTNSQRMTMHTVTVVCSPKTGKINEGLAPFIDAYKYVVHKDSIDQHDGLPTLALAHSAKPRVARPHPLSVQPMIYVQPIDVQVPEENEEHLHAAMKSCLTFGYSLCIQIHKIINVE